MRKGSISLSTSAIVILILAIAMLGLGLGFMKGMWGKASDKIDLAVSNTQLDNPASPEHPLTVSPKESEVTRGDSLRLDFDYFNSHSGPAILDDFEAICYQEDVYTSPEFGLTYPQSRDVETGKRSQFSVLVEAKSTTTPGSHSCTLELNDNVGPIMTVDFFIKVK